VEDEELEVLALGVLEEGAHGFRGLTLAGTDGHVVALGQLGGLKLRELALLLDVEDLVEGVLGELVASNLARAQGHGLARVGLMEVPARRSWTRWPPKAEWNRS